MNAYFYEDGEKEDEMHDLEDKLMEIDTKALKLMKEMLQLNMERGRLREKLLMCVHKPFLKKKDSCGVKLRRGDDVWFALKGKFRRDGVDMMEGQIVGETSKMVKVMYENGGGRKKKTYAIVMRKSYNMVKRGVDMGR